MPVIHMTPYILARGSPATPLENLIFGILIFALGTFHIVLAVSPGDGWRRRYLEFFRKGFIRSRVGQFLLGLALLIFGWTFVAGDYFHWIMPSTIQQLIVSAFVFFAGAVLVENFLEWKRNGFGIFHRCPHCKGSLEFRFYRNNCPHCGNSLEDPPDGAKQI